VTPWPPRLSPTTRLPGTAGPPVSFSVRVPVLTVVVPEYVFGAVPVRARVPAPPLVSPNTPVALVTTAGRVRPKTVPLSIVLTVVVPVRFSVPATAFPITVAPVVLTGRAVTVVPTLTVFPPVVSDAP